MGKLAELFKWKKEVSITDNGGNILATVYMRIVGDDILKEAREMSLRKSRLLRMRLRDEDSQEYQATFAGIDSITKEEMINTIIVSEIPHYRDEILATLPSEEKPELDESANLEEQEEHQSKVDVIESGQSVRTKTLLSSLEKRADERRKELNKLVVKVIKRDYLTSMVEVRCNEEFITTFREYLAYRGTFDDSKYTKLSFSSFDEFLTSATQLKDKLLSEYNTLELNGEQLKN